MFGHSYFIAYMNWMSPPDEMIVIKPKQSKESEKAIVNKTSTDPEVRKIFIRVRFFNYY